MQWAVCSVQCTVYMVQCPDYRVQGTVRSGQCSGYRVHIVGVQCVGVYDIVYIYIYTMFSVNMYSVQCAVCCVLSKV